MPTSPEPDRPDAALPPAVESAACEILLGPAHAVDARYEALCSAHEPLRPALRRLRTFFERAAHVLGDDAAEPQACCHHRPTRCGSCGSPPRRV